MLANTPICPQVSEHASWSAQYYKRIIDAALAAAGAPANLVQVRPRALRSASRAPLASCVCSPTLHFTALLPCCLTSGLTSPLLPLPARPLQIVTGYGEAGQALVTSPDVGKLIFVGSTLIGRKVGGRASGGRHTCRRARRKRAG